MLHEQNCAAVIIFIAQGGKIFLLPALFSHFEDTLVLNNFSL